MWGEVKGSAQYIMMSISCWRDLTQEHAGM